MTRTAIRADNVIIRVQERAGFVEIRKFTVGENNDTLHIACNENILQGGGC